MVDVADFKSRDAESYDLLAESFDHHTERYSHYAVDALLDFVDMDASRHVIDIGCGTGVVALALGQRAPQIRVTGIDLSEGMLAFARAKADRLGLADHVTFSKGDAEALAIESGSVDAAVSLYAWRHLPNPAKAAAEVHRVLRRGGRFAVAVGSAPRLLSGAGLRAAIEVPFRRLSAARGQELSACDHIDRLVERELSLPAGGEEAAWTEEHHEFSGSMNALLSEAGFAIVGSIWRGRQYQVDNAEDFWDLQTTFSSVARKRIAAASAAEQARLRAAFDAECGRVTSRGGRLMYRVGAAIVCGEKQ